jgi:hypothetical protein
MTPQERKYLRSLYHHFDDRQIRHTSTPEYPELVKEWKKFRTVLTAMLLILSIQGDMDDEIIPRIDELFEENGIELLTPTEPIK